MQKYVEVNMHNVEDIKQAAENIHRLVSNGYDIFFVQDIDDKGTYGIHLKKE